MSNKSHYPTGTKALIAALAQEHGEVNTDGLLHDWIETLTLMTNMGASKQVSIGYLVNVLKAYQQDRDLQVEQAGNSCFTVEAAMKIMDGQ